MFHCRLRLRNKAWLGDLAVHWDQSADQQGIFIQKGSQKEHGKDFECVNVSDKAADIQLKLAKVKSAYTQAMKEHYGLEEAHLATR